MIWSPLAAQTKPLMVCSCPERVLVHAHWSRQAQSFTARSAPPEASHAPEASNARQCTALVWPLSDTSSLPLSASHTFT